MTCDHPDCTGVHDMSRLVAEQCPAATERGREHHRQRYATDPEDRERRRERHRQRYATDPEYRERRRERYWNLSGYEYNCELLRKRRSKALARIAARKARIEQEKRLEREVSNG